jgi:hypothetical protein
MILRAKRPELLYRRNHAWGYRARRFILAALCLSPSTLVRPLNAAAD